MSLENSWNDLNKQDDKDLSSMLQHTKIKQLTSVHPLDKIRKSLFVNMIWCAAICVLYIVMIAYFRIWQVQASIFVTLVFTVWALLTAYQQYKHIKTTISSINPVLTELKRHYTSLQNWMKTQQQVALLIYPISATGGFMLGGVLGSGKSVNEFMSKPAVLIILLVTLAILVPACYFLGQWLFKYSFGKHMAAIAQNIAELEDEK